MTELRRTELVKEFVERLKLLTPEKRVRAIAEMAKRNLEYARDRALTE